jgi:ABC-type microcin C transport system permease subunit YejB
MKNYYEVSVNIGDPTEDIYLNIHANISITDGGKEECHGSMVEMESSLEIDSIAYAEMVTYGIAVEVTEQVKKKYKMDKDYRNHLDDGLKDIINDSDLEQIIVE